MPNFFKNRRKSIRERVKKDLSLGGLFMENLSLGGEVLSLDGLLRTFSGRALNEGHVSGWALNEALVSV